MFLRLILAAVIAGNTLAASAQVQVVPAYPSLSFTRPVDLQHAGDGSGRLFVVEQGGTVRVFDGDQTSTESELFLDLRDRIDTGGNEEGLLGLAFHPEYARNGYLYVNYTAASPDRTVISRFTVSGTNPDAADPASEMIILEFTQPFSNHNGGQLAFGPGGYLYIGTGDGGSGGDPQNNAQNRQSLLGKILRIDVDTATHGRAYAIPADNPFAGNTGGFREEIWAYGLRNPWRFSFDPDNGALWVGDVGQNRYEEINLVEAGGNYGWRTMEGFSCFNPPTGCEQDGLTLPVWVYGHDEGQSVTGGHVYRGSAVPALAGTYVYADFVSGKIWGLREEGGSWTNETLAASGLNVSSFGVDEAGELHFCAFDGSVYRFAPLPTGTDDTPSPCALALSALYPNPLPMAASASAVLTLLAASHVHAVLYDVLGRPQRSVVDAVLAGGTHTLRIDAAQLEPGIYMLAVTAGGAFTSRRLVVR